MRHDPYIPSLQHVVIIRVVMIRCQGFLDIVRRS